MDKSLLIVVMLLALAGSASAENIIVSVAHPDDETIAAAGIMMRHAAAGDNITVIVFTDGAPSEYNQGNEITETRKKELAISLGKINVTNIIYFDYDDLNFIFDLSDEENVELIHSLSASFTALKADKIYTHAYEHGHIDHDSVAFLTKKAADRAGIISYEFNENTPYEWGVPLHEDFIVLDMTEQELDLKKEMLYSFTSQDVNGNCEELNDVCKNSLLETYYTGKDKYRIIPSYDYTASPCENDSCRFENHPQGWHNIYAKFHSISELLEMRDKPITEEANQTSKMSFIRVAMVSIINFFKSLLSF